MDQKIIKSQGKPTVVSEKLVEVPEEFRMNTIDVSVETREYILSQSKNQGPWFRDKRTKTDWSQTKRFGPGPALAKFRIQGPDQDQYNI